MLGINFDRIWAERIGDNKAQHRAIEREWYSQYVSLTLLIFFREAPNRTLVGCCVKSARIRFPACSRQMISDTR